MYYKITEQDLKTFLPFSAIIQAKFGDLKAYTYMKPHLLDLQLQYREGKLSIKEVQIKVDLLLKETMLALPFSFPREGWWDKSIRITGGEEEKRRRKIDLVTNLTLQEIKASLNLVIQERKQLKKEQEEADRLSRIARRKEQNRLAEERRLDYRNKIEETLKIINKIEFSLTEFQEVFAALGYGLIKSTDLLEGRDRLVNKVKGGYCVKRGVLI